MNTLKRALIVDDDPIRHEGFKKIFADVLRSGKVELFHAFTVAEAQTQVREAAFPGFHIDPVTRKITEPEPFTFDAIFLDHDCDLQRGPDFIEFARFLCDMRDMVGNPNILIHSHNPVGAANMLKLLGDSGFTVKTKPFSLE